MEKDGGKTRRLRRSEGIATRESIIRTLPLRFLLLPCTPRVARFTSTPFRSPIHANVSGLRDHGFKCAKFGSNLTTRCENSHLGCHNRRGIAPELASAARVDFSEPRAEDGRMRRRGRFTGARDGGFDRFVGSGFVARVVFGIGLHVQVRPPSSSVSLRFWRFRILGVRVYVMWLLLWCVWRLRLRRAFLGLHRLLNDRLALYA